MDSHTRTAGLLAFGSVFLLFGGGLAALVTLASLRDEAGPTTTAAARAPRRPDTRPAEPAPPPAPPAVRREEVSGYVLEVRAVGLNESVFWGVPRGTGAVTLADAPDADRAARVCVFAGAAPDLEPGARRRFAGRPAGVTPGGAAVYADCELLRD